MFKTLATYEIKRTNFHSISTQYCRICYFIRLLARDYSLPSRWQTNLIFCESPATVWMFLLELERKLTFSFMESCNWTKIALSFDNHCHPRYTCRRVWMRWFKLFFLIFEKRTASGHFFVSILSTTLSRDGISTWSEINNELSIPWADWNNLN